MTSSGDLDLSAATAAIAWQAPGTHSVLAIYGEDVWFWSLQAPGEPLADVAGTFRSAASASERTALCDLLIRLADAPDAGGAGLVVTAGGRTARLDATGEPAAAVAKLATPLLAADRIQPTRAVRLGAAAVTAPGGRSVLGLSFASIGSEPVTVRLDADGVRLLDPDGPWRSLAAPRMGLVDGEGNLLDGRYTAATIPAGGLGAWLLGEVDSRPGRRVRASGTITLAGPVTATLRFDLSAAVQ
jgi:hypothetical protein